MRKEWLGLEVTELSIAETANTNVSSTSVDGTWSGTSGDSSNTMGSGTVQWTEDDVYDYIVNGQK